MGEGSVASPPFRALGPVHPEPSLRGRTIHKRGIRRQLPSRSLKTRPRGERTWRYVTEERLFVVRTFHGKTDRQMRAGLDQPAARRSLQQRPLELIL